MSCAGAALVALALAAAPGAGGRGGGPAAARRLADGERLYLLGVLGPGRPVEAVVSGDVPATGAQLRCAACHGRSGMGSAEGDRVVPAVAGAVLRSPRPQRPTPRPAYDEAAIARAIRDGVDPAGRPLDPLMPRFRLGGDDLAALVAYLDALGRPSPGVSADALHLATVVAPGARPAVRAATLAVARAFVRRRNDAARVERRSHPRDLLEREYRGEWVLHEWTLSGPPRTWEAQLAARLAARPVFALVSGAGGDAWLPVERFCEAHRIPCLLPNVDTPPEEGEGWYALHFSGGAVLEARAIAAHLSRTGEAPSVVQVHRGGAGGAAASALAAALRRAGGAALTLELAPGEPFRPAAVAARARAAGAAAVVLWLGEADLAPLRRAPLPGRLPAYLSSTLLGRDLAVTGALAVDGWIAHPGALPSEAERRFPAVAAWLAASGVAAPDAVARRTADQTLFALRAFSEAFDHASRGLLSRDFLLEALDHASGLALLSSHLGRVAFGPGQRRLVRGAWIVPLRGPESAAAWVVP